MSRQQTPPIHPLPHIAGYTVSWGRVLLHARWRGTYADARARGRPWHVVGSSPERLVEAVERGWPTRPGEGHDHR